MRTVLILMACGVPGFGETILTLRQAVSIALARNPSLEAAAARIRAAQARAEAARGNWLPKANYQESWQRSNNPVFVFSSLLTQHQFTESNFGIGLLNRPDFLNNFQSVVSVDQTVYDGRRTSTEVKTAEINRTMTEEERRSAQMAVIAGVARTYYGSVLAQAALETANAAVKSAEADLRRAESVLQAGLSTEADVLSIRVHLAAVREQQITRTYNLQTARAALNEALGLALDEPHDLTTPLSDVSTAETAVADLEQRAAEARPEARQAGLATRLASTQVSGARGALLPQVSLRGVFEADRQRFAGRGGANWFAGATLRWNIFNGHSDGARIREASEALAGAQKQEEQVGRGIRLQVRTAWGGYQSARERVTVAQAAVSQAEESLRIIKNRYDNGLTTVTELLRGETALLDARMRRLNALYDVRVSAAVLYQSAGILTGDSDVLR